MVEIKKKYNKSANKFDKEDILKKLATKKLTVKRKLCKYWAKYDF